MEEKDAKVPYTSETKMRNTMAILNAGVMICLAAAAWVITLLLMNSMNPMTSGMERGKFELPIFSMAPIFTSADPSMILSFLSVWTVGMIAMMFPAMIPVITIHTTSVARSEMRSGVARVLGIPLFLAGYLLLYAVLGAGVYAVIYLAFYLAGFIPALAAYALPAASGILFAAGIWQVTPLKDRCLSKCVSPLGFFLLHGRKGLAGAFRMGAEHGYYCVGCCWMYMLVMLGVAAMSIPSMVLLASLITVEKAIVHGAMWFRWVSAAIFITLGAAIILVPQLFIL
jgi:predicted metal-binding membrane protein